VTVPRVIGSGGRMSTGPEMIKVKHLFYHGMGAAFPPPKMATQFKLGGGFIPAATKSAPGSPADAIREAFGRTGQIRAKVTFG
jgi:hypothetical protein